MNEENKEIKTSSKEPFAVLQVPESVLEDIIERPNISEDLKQIIGVKVLVISQDVRLLQGSYAREEVERVHNEIEAFLGEKAIPKEPSAMTQEELTDEIFKLQNERTDLRIRVQRLCLALARMTCPYSVGDIMVSKHGERAVITEIIGAEPGKVNDPLYRITGHYLKKDGTPAMNPGRHNNWFRICTFHEWEKWKKEGDDDGGQKKS